ncbi:MAG: cob(I)yrinic acid a,c-diamide adenosyltransferase [Fibrobacteria bacterium]|nr:cob(I)yrinic acid a,c-diamide adenosyltransferase [Fibrobacteria bacterium]
MPPLHRLYTKAGDSGSTRLGGGQKVSKDSIRLECYGTVDELNSNLGLALAYQPVEPLRSALGRIQNELFHLGSDLCFLEEDKKKWTLPKIEPRHVEVLEREMDSFQESTGPLANFILPAGNPAAAQLHVSRTVCRRAERLLVRLGGEEVVAEEPLRYLNRLSDWLFAAARLENHARGIPEVLWDASA